MISAPNPLGALEHMFAYASDATHGSMRSRERWLSTGTRPDSSASRWRARPPPAR
jgi:hypothetical protein